jgi:hypothetical protein
MLGTIIKKGDDRLMKGEMARFGAGAVWEAHLS